MEVIGKYENAFNIMTNSENSQLVLESRKQHIKLAPKYMANIRGGISQHLSTLLSRQDKIFEGFPVAYNNIKLQQAMGKMVSDQTCIHFDIHADFIMFKPTIGCKLYGKINKVAKRHIGCLVHGHFNAWVPHTSSTEKMAVDKLIGSELEFTVQDISTNRNVLSIKGKFEKLLSKGLETMITIQPVNQSTKQQKRQKNKGKKDETTDVSKRDINENNLDGGGDDRDKQTVKKKKKHRKDVVGNSEDSNIESAIESQGDSIRDESESEQTSKMKRKHNKDKRKSHKATESVNEGIGLENINDSIASLVSCEPLFTSTQIEGKNWNDQNNDSEEKDKSKKHKKRRHEESASEVEMSLGQSDSMVNGDTDLTETSELNDSVKKKEKDSKFELEQSKSRKRRLEEESFTKLKSKDGVNKDFDLGMPSAVKKQKKHKIEKVEAIECDSSVDFEDSSLVTMKAKKKKKHKDKAN